MTADAQRRSQMLHELEAEYEMLRELGRGGMAVVYLARARATGREVAIKVIRASYLEDRETVARFEREASLLTRLQHPSIVPVLEIKQLSDGSLALVMERVPGRTLKRAIGEDGAFGFRRA
jgi:eukaryotic-like serine/threonine-protein kinase